MSDLAPFVAAAIRDRTVLDLQKELETERSENEKLRQQLDWHNARLIRITGPGGFPIYAHRRLDGLEHDDLLNYYLRNSTGDFVDTSLASCPFQEIDKCELHIGGKMIFVLGNDEHPPNSFTRLSAGECAMQWCAYYRYSDDERIVHVSVCFGVDTDPNSAVIHFPREYRNDDVSYVRFHMIELRGIPGVFDLSN